MRAHEAGSGLQAIFFIETGWKLSEFAGVHSVKINQTVQEIFMYFMCCTLIKSSEKRPKTRHIKIISNKENKKLPKGSSFVLAL